MELEAKSFTDPAVQRCPYGMIDRLLKGDRVYRDPVTGFYVIGHYDDIAFVNDHPELFSNRTAEVLHERADTPQGHMVAKRYAEKGWHRIHTLVTNDPPDHTVYRALLEKVFTASNVKRLEDYIAKLVDDLIDDFIEAGEVDFQRYFCVRLPMYVIVDQLGIPRDEWEQFKRWSDATIAIINPILTDEERLALADQHIEMQQFIYRQGERYRANPDDDKVLSRIRNATIDGRPLTDTEFLSVAEHFFVAGNETTTSALGHAVLMLIQDEGLRATLAANPEKINAFVEESLRIHAPSPQIYRKVVQDVTIGGCEIPAGSMVMLHYLAGNLDEDRFQCPEKVDLERKGVRNHLAFGKGIHYCVGNLLARAEIRLAVKHVLARLHELRLDPGYPEPQLAESFHVHVLDSLHVKFRPGEKVASTGA